jgi:demethylmenaquinone methyltransferase/2-methoxy-6-polyprenyl-1,4-benzoquinol methylase
MNDKHTDHTTHFGFEEVKVEDKVRRVRGVFDSVASNYDIMNDVMSMGVHRLWKRVTVEVAALRAGQQVLDLAGGTGDLTRLMAERVGPSGKIVISDINGNMLGVGRDTLINSGHVGNIEYVQANAEVLPFPDNQFHCVTIGFGLRNVTDKDRALR